VKHIASIGGIVAGLLLAGTPRLAAQSPERDSLTLDRAIEMALRNAPSIRQAEGMVAASQAHTEQVGSLRYPHIEADASYRRVDPTISVQLPLDGELRTFSFFPNDNYEAAVTARQTLYDFGRTDALEDLARSGERTAGDRSEEIRSTIAYRTIAAFNGTLLTQRHLAVLDEQIAALEQNLRIAQQRLENGTATSYDVLTTQVRLTSVRNQRADVENDLRKAEAGLRRLLDLPSAAHLALQGTFEIADHAIEPDTLEAMALRQRPEVVSARDAVVTAELQQRAASTENRPTLSLSVSGGVKNGFPPELNDPKLNWAGGLNLNVPLFDGFHSRYAEEEAEAAMEAASAHLEDVEQGVRLDVETAMSDLQTSRQKQETADVQVEQARRALDLARTRYTNGVITNLELLNAQAALQEAEFYRVRLMYDYAMDYYELQHAVGSRPW